MLDSSSDGSDRLVDGGAQFEWASCGHVDLQSVTSSKSECEGVKYLAPAHNPEPELTDRHVSIVMSNVTSESVLSSQVFC